MGQIINTIKVSRREYLIIAIAFLLALVIGIFAVQTNLFFLPVIPVLILGAIIYLIILFREPLIGLFSGIGFAFLFGVFSREIGGLQYGIGNELIMVLTWLSVWYNADRYDFNIIKNNLFWLTLFWFILSVLQLGNPAGASPRGWLQEIRNAALYPLMVVPLGILLLNTPKRINYFLYFILFLSLLASLNGLKQERIGLSPGEQAFLDDVGGVTHLIFGQLRVFSFYSDAGQFGASQAHFVVIAIVLAAGLKGWGKKFILYALAAISFYGMLISGTRGAFFALVGGIFFAIALSKNFKSMIIGGTLAILFVCFLKFTYIGSGNYHIHRLRSALDTDDASLNMRVINQQKLADYLSTHPFGGGLGVMGDAGVKYNAGNYLSSIAPDSYWVKVWGMYGIIGLIIFFCLWCFILGNAAGMVWFLKDKALRVKLVALLAGVFGIFLCSYGNEVMNTMPSITVIHLSLGIIYGVCIRAKESEKNKLTPVIIN